MKTQTAAIKVAFTIGIIIIVLSSISVALSLTLLFSEESRQIGITVLICSIAGIICSLAFFGYASMMRVQLAILYRLESEAVSTKGHVAIHEQEIAQDEIDKIKVEQELYGESTIFGKRNG